MTRLVIDTHSAPAWEPGASVEVRLIAPDVEHTVTGTLVSPVRPLPGLDAHTLAQLIDTYPCLPGERHTFDAGARVCLCGALAVGVDQEHPHVVLYSPVAAS